MKCDCETLQPALSDALDDGNKPDPGLIARARECEDCTRFLELWMHGGPEELTAPHAPAGIALRKKILDLPEQAAGKRGRIVPFLIQAAAVILFFAGVVRMLDIGPVTAKPENSSLVEKILRKSVEKEIEAIESDVDNGLASLGSPLLALRESFRTAP